MPTSETNNEHGDLKYGSRDLYAFSKYYFKNISVIKTNNFMQKIITLAILLMYCLY